MARGKKKGRNSQAKYTDRTNELEMSNERFEKYYRAQQILPDDEWDAFMTALRQPLPSTFRIAANRQMKDVLSDSIKNKFLPQLEAARLDGEPLPVPQPIPWYPDGLAWHVGIARKELKKFPEYKKFHEFLVYETEIGNISRQEAVSMLPPLFLDARPSLSVVDLCAAPGSKTSQLLEAMDPPTGILIANDSDNKRAHLLVHQSSRLPSPGLMVTNLDASIFPTLKYKDGPLQFDRILADVPCSGDGTLRKNIGIWARWNPLEANGLHSLQLRILQRAMRMLKNDASFDDRPRIVYSTCSLNPVENEAVVAAALNSVHGFELVDVSEILPSLTRRPGLSSWRPAVNREADVPFATYKDYCNSFATAEISYAVENIEDAEEPTRHGRIEANKNGKSDTMKKRTQHRKVQRRLPHTFWPSENVSDLHLDRCLRIYPHLQNTGGFFVAVLQRHSPRRRPTEPIDANVKSDELTAEPSTKRVKLSDGKEMAEETCTADILDLDEPVAQTGGTFKEEPYTFISPDDPTLLSCIETHRLKDSFPRSNIFVRNAEGQPVRSLYLVNDTVRSVMEQMDHKRIRLISAGVKLFGRSELANTKKQREKADGSAGRILFRVLQEGLLALLPYANQESMVVGGAKELRVLLEDYYPLCSSFDEPFRSKIAECPVGSHIIRFGRGDYSNASLSHDLSLPLWKSETSVSLMIDKRSKSAISLRFFGEDVTVAGRLAAKQRGGKKAKTENMSSDADDVDVDESEDRGHRATAMRR